MTLTVPSKGRLFSFYVTYNTYYMYVVDIENQTGSVHNLNIYKQFLISIEYFTLNIVTVNIKHNIYIVINYNIMRNISIK